MSKLGDALREKFRDPREALKALGLDESLLGEATKRTEKTSMTKPTRLAAFTLGLTAAAVAPVLAQDAKLELPKKLFSEITSKNFKAKKSELLSGVRLALDGKLRKGLALDEGMKGVEKAMDNMEDLVDGEDESVSESQHNAMEAAAHGESNLGIPKSVGKEFSEADKGKTFDAEPIKALLKEKGMDEETINKVCDMLPKAAAKDETPEERKEHEEAGSRLKELEDKDKARDAAMKDMVTKPAMDAAIEAAVKATRDTERAIRQAIEDVRPHVGKFSESMSFDSADAVYGAALTALKVDTKGVPPQAFKAMLNLVPKAGARPAETPLAQDAATVQSFEERYPGAKNIQAA